MQRRDSDPELIDPPRYGSDGTGVYEDALWSFRKPTITHIFYDTRYFFARVI